jgi:hypothetical protein
MERPRKNGWERDKVTDREKEIMREERLIGDGKGETERVRERKKGYKKERERKRERNERERERERQKDWLVQM